MTYVTVLTLFFISNNIVSQKIRWILKAIAYLLLSSLIILLYTNHVIDTLSFTFSLLANIVVAPISLYTDLYSKLGDYPRTFPLVIDIFSVLMVTAYTSPNILFLAISWTLAELLAFFIVSIGEEHSIEGSTRASKRFLFVSALTFEISLFTMVYVSIFALVSVVSGYVDVYRALTDSFTSLENISQSVSDYIVPLLVIGFIAKAALVPLHFWLPDAHSVAPAPGSALLSGVMTAMGVYGMFRVFMLIRSYPLWIIYLLIILSIASILYGGLQSIVQRDGKRLLAYSTIAGNGFAMLVFSLYLIDKSPDTLSALIIAVAAHMSYKSTLFLEIGLAEYVTGLRFIHRLRGLAKVLPYSSMGGLLAVFSIIGLPPTAGFIAKLASILVAIKYIPSITSIAVVIGVTLFIIVSILMATRYMQIYYGKPIVLVEKKHLLIHKMEYIVLILSMTNVLYSLIMLISLHSIMYTLLYVVALPPLLIISYALITIGRRGV